jgi:hypothetical protein
MTRLEALEAVASAARHVRALERVLVEAKDSRLAMDRLNDARQILDTALDVLERKERGLS